MECLAAVSGGIQSAEQLRAHHNYLLSEDNYMFKAKRGDARQEYLERPRSIFSDVLPNAADCLPSVLRANQDGASGWASQFGPWQQYTLLQTPQKENNTRSSWTNCLRIICTRSSPDVAPFNR